MKRVYIIRHAKSSWKDMSLDDFDRPLNRRGKENIPLMAERLKSKAVMPDAILSSPALRAKKTAEKLAKKIGYKKKITFYEDMYESSEKILHLRLHDLDDEVNVAFIVAHNTGLNMLAQFYVGFDDNIPTLGILEVGFDCEKWSDISPENASFLSFDYPKKIYNLPLESIQKDL